MVRRIFLIVAYDDSVDRIKSCKSRQESHLVQLGVEHSVCDELSLFTDIR